MKKDSGFSLLLVLIIVALLGVGGYFLYLWGCSIDLCDTRRTLFNSSSTPTPQSSPIDTSNWTTYTNKKYNVSFKYPSNWFMFIDLYGKEISKVGLEHEDFIFITPDEPCLRCGGIPRGIRISFGSNNTNLTTQQYVSNQVITKSEPGNNLISYSADIANLDAIIVEGYIGAGCPGPYLYALTSKVFLEMQTECLLKSETNAIFKTINIH